MPGKLNGVLHRYTDKLTAFEYKEEGAAPKPNSLIFIGGLTDGLCTVSFLDEVAAALQDTTWSVFSVLLSSSYKGFGTSTLDKDVAEISQAVSYVSQYKREACGANGLVSIMGHSTGSQDVLHYIYTPEQEVSKDGSDSNSPPKRVPVDGAILQSPVSDREALLDMASSSSVARNIYNELLRIARDENWAGEGEDNLLPNPLFTQLGLFEPDTPMTCGRFLSLASPESPERPSADDLFSSDLGDERLRKTFGVVAERGVLRGRMLVLYGGADEYVPEKVDREGLVGRWEKVVRESAPGREIWDANSGVVPGATHAPGEQLTGPRKDIARRVKSFLGSLEESVKPAN